MGLPVPGLVRAHQARVADHINGEDREIASIVAERIVSSLAAANFVVMRCDGRLGVS